MVESNSKIHNRVCLDGGYHFLDELTKYSSDLRPTSRLLCTLSVGILELGILNAQGLALMKSNRTTELMVAVWMGTQADESFPDAWHLDALLINGDGVGNIRSKVYLSPRLWYVRVHVIEAQELQTVNQRQPEVFVKGSVMNMVLRTKPLRKPLWDEDLMFVVAEPFDEQPVSCSNSSPSDSSALSASSLSKFLDSKK